MLIDQVTSWIPNTLESLEVVYSILVSHRERIYLQNNFGMLFFSSISLPRLETFLEAIWTLLFQTCGNPNESHQKPACYGSPPSKSSKVNTGSLSRTSKESVSTSFMICDLCDWPGKLGFWCWGPYSVLYCKDELQCLENICLLC